MFAIIIKQVRTFIPTITVLNIATVLSYSFVLASLNDPIVNFHTVHTFFICTYSLSITLCGIAKVPSSKHLMALTLLIYLSFLLVFRSETITSVISTMIITSRLNSIKPNASGQSTNASAIAIVHISMFAINFIS